MLSDDEPGREDPQGQGGEQGDLLIPVVLQVGVAEDSVCYKRQSRCSRVPVCIPRRRVRSV